MPDDANPEIRALAARQHGLVTRAQLLSAGLTADTVDGRVRAGRFRPIQRGVYRVGAAAQRERQMAAVLCAPGAAVSHRSAAGLQQLLPDPTEVEIIVKRCHGNRPGIRIHRAALDPDEVTVLDGIPLTTPARTLLDLAGILSHRELEQAMGQAERLGRRTGKLRELMVRRPRRPGVAMLRALLEDPRRLAVTRSEAEERLLGLIRSARLPSPETNTMVSGVQVDFIWRSERLIVEVDGFAYHSSRARFEKDRQRDTTLIAAGFTVMRVTWRQLAHERDRTLGLLAQALVSSAARIPRESLQAARISARDASRQRSKHRHSGREC